MDVVEAVFSRRSIRKFQDKPVPRELLIKLVECAGAAPYPSNVQPLKFMISGREDGERMLGDIFSCTKWAGYIPDGAPRESERPTAYLIILGDRKIKPNGDFKVEKGIAGTTVTLCAEDMGLASCWIGAVDREKLARVLKTPDDLEITDLVALGYAAQKSRAVPMKDGDVKYFLSPDGTMNVPKRSLEEILLL